MSFIVKNKYHETLKKGSRIDADTVFDHVVSPGRIFVRIEGRKVTVNAKDYGVTIHTR